MPKYVLANKFYNKFYKHTFCCTLQLQFAMSGNIGVNVCKNCSIIVQLIEP